MVVSFIHPHTCGFAKAAIWRFTKDAVVNIKRVDTETPYQHRVRTVQAIHELFCQMFGSTKFAVDYKTFERKLPDLRKKFSGWNPRKYKERDQYLNAFSADCWKELSTTRKDEHSLMDCPSCCHRYSVYQALFPVNSRQFQGFLKENPVVVAQNIAANVSKQPVQIKCTRREYQTGAQTVYDEINPVFQQVFNVSLEKALTTLPTLNIQAKKSCAEKKKERRNDLRKTKACLEEQWKNTSVMR
jgi:hypothetical protein